MMDLTPLDVRKKKGDFRRGLRGYESAQVDDFLDLVADRLEAIVRDAAPLRDRVAQLEQQVKDYRDRERALTEALVSAQQMREDIKSQSTREVEMLRRQAVQEAEQIRAGAEKDRAREEQAIQALRARQVQFLQSYRTYLEQELSELSAMNRAIEMHAANPAAVLAAAVVPRGPAVTPVQPTAPPDSQNTRASAVDLPAQPPPSMSEARPAVPATAPAPSPIHASPVTAVAVPRPGPLAAGSASGHGSGAGIEAQLDKALARWEPELETPDTEPEAVIHEAEYVDSEEAEDLELLLSDDDVVSTNEEGTEAAVVAMTEEEAAVDLGFLDFDDDAAAASAALEPTVEKRPPADPAVVDREVTAAMGDTDADFIEIGGAFSQGGRLAVPGSVNAEAGGRSTGDSADEFEIEADFASDFGVDPAVDALFEDDPPLPDPAETGPAASAETGPLESARSDSSDLAEFVDAVVFDAETAFNEEPTDHGSDSLVVGSARGPAAARAASDAGFDDEFEIENGPSDAEEAFADGGDSDLIDIESFGAPPDRQHAEAREEDVSSLTLHPMFFEEESSDMPGVPDSHEHGHEDAGRDQWSSSGGG